jgi:Photosynthetic reaction centre cytochrome C subunit/Tetratricopeptide repeat
MRLRFIAFLIAMPLAQSTALAQQPGSGVPDMQTIALGLGVKCEFCHAGQRGAQTPSATTAQEAPSKMAVARAMIGMTRDLNARISEATGKTAADATQVTCVTCHRGVTIPGQLSDIVAKTALEQSPDAAIAQYRDLRQRYYGGQSYDFREETLLEAAQRVVRINPPASISLLRLNLEYYPQSVRSYIQIASAYTRKLDDEAAIAALEKALEIEPENGVVKGQLEQLKSYRRRK